MQRVDLFPTREYKGMKLRPGRVYPFGASVIGNAINFAVYSRNATACTLVLFRSHEKEPFAEIPFFKEFRLGNVFCMMVFDLNYEDIEYGFRMDGPWDPVHGQRFDSSKILMDPYAKLISGRNVWGEQPDYSDPYLYRAKVLCDDFDWEDDLPLNTPSCDLVIYELHVRNFTADPSSQTVCPGTFAGLAEKIPYLKKLGVNCVELMPIFEFDEFENSRISPITGEMLYNVWGYSNIGFFAPKAGFASTGAFNMQSDELKTTIKQLHAAGIEVFLDVVFNHTAEGNEKGPYISYRGIDNSTYYMLTPEGYYFNFSGCGNTLNCNNPNVRNMIVDCLRYWAADYHIDGFRFDLAAILGRDQNGLPMQNPPLLESLAYDPILGNTKLIAEAWDAGGLYQVGSFPSWGRWAEWNGKFRDTVRRFVKGDEGLMEDMQCRLCGSPDLYAGSHRGVRASVNFITAHDGFTMMDLVSYNGKHNAANGENNRDGENHNNSWNCGMEGSTTDEGVNRLRHKQIKNLVTLLMLSEGIPMILSGDEMGNTQFGNNNAYCQDNSISHIDWNDLEKNADLFAYFKKIITLRRFHPMLRRNDHLRGEDYLGSGYPDISWHSRKAWSQADNNNGLTFAMMLDGRYATHADGSPDDFIYMAMNMHWEASSFELPHLPEGYRWYVAANTDMPSGSDIFSPGREVLLDHQEWVLAGPRSIVILVGRAVGNYNHHLRFCPLKNKTLEIVNEVMDIPGLENLPESLSLSMRLVVEEIVTNVVSYAYVDNSNGQAWLEFSMEKNAERIKIEFRDAGRAFNPLEIADPDIDANLATREIGGLGIYLVKELCSDVKYVHKDGMNILKLFIDLNAKLS